MGSPPGSPYAVSVELMITMMFSAMSTSSQGAGHLAGPHSSVQRHPRPLGRTNNIRFQRCRVRAAGTPFPATGCFNPARVGVF